MLECLDPMRSDRSNESVRDLRVDVCFGVFKDACKWTYDCKTWLDICAHGNLLVKSRCRPR